MKRITLLCAAALGALNLASCRDDLVPATMGFIAVRTGNTFQVEVALDDDVVGTDPGVLGPLEAGTYRVSASRECYRVDAAERLVTVAPAETTIVDFEVTLAEFGTVRVSAVDELTGEDVDGALVFVETGPGVFTATGQTTPALVDSVGCGTARFRLEKAGFEPSPIVETIVDTGEESQVVAELGPMRATLIEMFTYTTCPNCPYAADTIKTVIDDFPGEVYAVEWHSGANAPPFILYEDAWKARELYYTGGAPVGYPGTTIAGQLPLLVGGQTSDLSEYRPRSRAVLDACSTECPLTMRLEGTIGATSAELTARIKWRGGTLPGNLKLRFILVENDVLAPGNQPNFDFVPRVLDERPLLLTTPGEVVVLTSSLPVENWPPTGSSGPLQAIAWIQSDATLEILQVSGF